MKAIKNPNSITGLRIWFDASDITTINNGKVIDNGNVFSFRDKKSNIELTNSQGVNGPSYSIGAVNGRNAISMPYYTSSDVGLKALFSTGVNGLEGLTFSMFCVYKPTTTQEVNSNGNQKYVVSIYSNSRWNALIGSPPSTGPGGFANRAIYTGDEGSASATAVQRLNPSGRYIEADTSPAPPWNGYVTYSEHVPSRSGSAPSSLNKTCLTQVRIQPGLKKMGFVFDDYEFVDDFQSSRIYNTGGSAGINRGIRNTGNVQDVGSNSTLILGSPWSFGKNKAEKLYPLEGFFCEFLYYNRYLNDSEYHTISRYLKKKWIE